MFSAASPMSMAPPPAATRPPFDHLSTSMSVSSTSTFVPNQVGVPETPNEVTAEPDGDGTGSFKEQVGPNSGAYLGSLSSAALLQHLQKCAADVNLSNPRGHVNAASPSSTITSSVALLPEHMERYLSAYFNVFHLQAQLADIVPRPDGESWELLHLVILGLGSLCVIGDSDLNETLMLYDKATNRIGKAQFESASLTSVQAFVLLGNFAQKVNHTSAGSVFLSIGLRMAINLGLHSEGAAQNESCFDQEQRRRVWWTLFVFESGAQITFGHPSVLPNAGVDVLPIVAVPDTSFTPAALFRPLSVDGPTAYSSLLYQTFFHQLANTFIPHFTLSQHSLTTAEVLRFYRDIDRFQASLPFYFLHPTAPFFNFTQHKLVWRLENLRMVVLRQTFLKVTLAQGPSTPDDESCFEQAVSCATRVIQSVQRFTESGPKSAMEWWYSLHFLLPAIFITLIALRAHTSSPGALDHLVTLQSARSVLSNATHPLLHPLASRCLSIISAVANLDSDNAGNARGDVLMGQMGDQDFTSFLEMFSGTAEMEGPMQSFGSDLDALFHFVTPAGSPGGSGHI
ncbi:hypothetical protein MNV49_006529 [Pseudohyphozyma bogoriensis]|nr:hypothetical protein MNV49_006529 [Pseudohyphozyma bogoriensis]